MVPATVVTSRHLRGINIQRPWARLIVDGVKTVEARKYELTGYLNEDLWIIETPGKGTTRRSYIGVDGKVTHESDKGKHVSHIIGIVRFGASFQYEDLAHWRADQARHRIPEEASSIGRGQKAKKHRRCTDGT